MNKYFDALKNHPLFKSFNDQQINALLSLSKSQELPPEEIIINEGEINDDIFIIIEGEVEILKKEDEGDGQYKIGMLNAGAVIGEMCLLEKVPRAATIQALSDTNILIISSKDILSLKNGDAESQKIYHEMIENIGRELCKRLRNTNEILAKLMHKEKIGMDASVSQGNMFVTMWSI